MAGAAGMAVGSTPRKIDPPTPKGRDTRRRIMDSAKRLFAEHGYAGVRISDITDAADLSPGAFYRYFTDRDELTLELLRELTNQAFEFVRTPWDAQQPSRSVLSSTQRYFEYYRQHRALFGVLVELSQTDARIAEIWAQSRRTFYARIAKSITHGIEAGQLRADLDVAVAAEMLGSMTEFYAFQRFVLNGSAIKDVDIAEATRTIAKIWTSGIQLQHTEKVK